MATPGESLSRAEYISSWFRSNAGSQRVPFGKSFSRFPGNNRSSGESVPKLRLKTPLFLRVGIQRQDTCGTTQLLCRGRLPGTASTSINSSIMGLCPVVPDPTSICRRSPSLDRDQRIAWPASRFIASSPGTTCGPPLEPRSHLIEPSPNVCLRYNRHPPIPRRDRRLSFSSLLILLRFPPFPSASNLLVYSLSRGPCVFYS